MSSMDIDTSLEYNDESEVIKENGDHSDSPAISHHMTIADEDVVMLEARLEPEPGQNSDESVQSSLAKSSNPMKGLQRLRNERKAQKEAFENDKRELNKSKIKDTARRFQFLLGHSELFSHFIDLKKSKDEGFKELVEETEKLNKSKQNSDGSRRHRKTEKEEDKELLEDVEDESEDVPTVFNESPNYIKNGTMRDYQLQGLNWMISLFENGINGILADEMGLGKTLQTISFLGYLKHYRNIPGPHLVVAPKSTLNNWQKEFNMWTPDFHILLLQGNKDERAQLINDRLLPQDFQVCITSYELCLIEKAHLKKFAFQYIIIDEAHRIKNENSMLSQIVRVFKSRNRLLITGTPLQNNLHELWALLNFLLPDVFSSSEDFDSWFSSQGGNQDNVIQQLHKVLRPFLLRRIKSDVEKSLLPKKEINLYVGMSSMQRKWYQRILEKDIAAVNGIINKSESKTRLLNIVMQLRKCCNHPYLFDGAEPGPPYTTDEHLVDNAGKMIVLDKLLKRLKAQGSRVLLFSQMSRVLDILEDYCIFRGYEYCRIDGQTKQDERVSAIDEYNAPGSSKFIFLLTTRNAIEEKVLERAAQKLRLDQLVIQQGRLAQTQKAATKEELLTMIQHGAEGIFTSNDSTVTDDDIDQILRKSEEKTAELSTKYQGLGLEDLQNFTSESAYQWQGEDWSNRQKKNELGRFNWIEPPKRERKVNYAVDSYYREALRVTTKPTQAKPPKAPKQITINEHQFYPPRLVELLKRDMYYQQKLAGYKVPLPEPQGDDDDVESREQERQEEQERIDNAEPLTEDEESERDRLMNEIFEDWSKRDFNNFVNASARWGRDAIEEIAEEMEGKTVKEVRAYAEVFWDRYRELPNYEEIISKVERGEAKLQQTADIQELIKSKVKYYRQPGHQLQISNQGKGKSLYTEEEDRYLLIALAKYGYGTDDVYEKIRSDIESVDMFKFNWFIKSRTTSEIARRCTTLINLIQKESGDEEEQDERPKRKETPSSNGTSVSHSKRRR
ncbi:hypothetical protein RhiirA4_550336 [Rhizophagus irregularis]|uniref:Uncharacterized protein n=1 Tax=Rhizophagus irregularis TaxID=588596 RepID=A0A2I1HKD8_9GLOM|nr:hypothetical protein RhiirA4_550336 [Rhizophagus irregularis]